MGFIYVNLGADSLRSHMDSFLSIGALGIGGDRRGAGKQIYKQSPLQTSVRAILRCIAESNRCPRFCRPVPNHSANAP